MKFNPRPMSARAAPVFASNDRGIPTMPTLAEFNAELTEWTEDEIEAAMYPSPPPSPTAFFSMAVSAPKPAPGPPSLNELVCSLTSSRDNLFFVAHRLPMSTTAEWQLVSVAFKDTMAINPDCLRDGKFLADFYICHPDDSTLNAASQRYWLEYHQEDAVRHSDRSTSYHLIRPSKTSHGEARARGLYPYRQWIFLAHSDVYIHGPFDFQMTPHGTQSRDRVAEDDWTVLRNKERMYANAPPALKQGTFSLHCSLLFDTEVKSTAVDKRVTLAPLLCLSNYTPPV